MCVRCDELEEQVAFLRGELGLSREAGRVDILVKAFGIQPAAAKLLLLLYQARGAIVTNGLLMDQISASSPDPQSVVKAHMCRLRTAMPGGVFETIWSVGYRATPSGLAKVAEALGEA